MSVPSIIFGWQLLSLSLSLRKLEVPLHPSASPVVMSSILSSLAGSSSGSAATLVVTYYPPQFTANLYSLTTILVVHNHSSQRVNCRNMCPSSDGSV